MRRAKELGAFNVASMIGELVTATRCKPGLGKIIRA
jgi:hypothetical protein